MSIHSLGIVSAIRSTLTARKVGYIRSLSSDIEEQAVLWQERWQQSVGDFLKESEVLGRWAQKELRRKAKSEKVARKRAAKENKKLKKQAKPKKEKKVVVVPEPKKIEAKPEPKPFKKKGPAMTRSKEEIQSSILKAQQEREKLLKTKGKGFKAIPREQQVSEEKQRLLDEARRLRSLAAEKARKEREEQRAKEETAKREQDRLRTEAHKIALLKAKQERDLWNQREGERQERLINRYPRVEETRKPIVDLKKVKEEKELENLRKEIARYQAELGL